MTSTKKSEGLRTKPKETQVSAGAEESTPERPPPTLPKAASTDPDPLPRSDAIPPIEGDFVPFSAEAYVSRLTEASEQNSRKTIFAKQIAEKGGIAELAVQMAPSEDDTESQVLEAMRRALLYREAEQYVLAELRESGDIESGLLKCKEAWERRQRHEDALKAIPYEYKTDATGNRLPVTLEEGLSGLMQHYGKDLRLPYFQQWLADDYLQQLSEEIQALGKQQDDDGLSSRKRIDAFALILMKEQRAARLRKDSCKLLIKVVERKIREMRRRGIPAGLFERARQGFQLWRAEKISETRRAAGRQGAKKKRRRAARPPTEEMKDILTDLKARTSESPLT